MKQIIIICFAIQLLISCQDGSNDGGNNNDNENTRVPILTLVGESEMYIEVGETFIDPGAVAVDSVDGILNDNIIKDGDIVDTSEPGTYIITYIVINSLGNSAEVTRTVNVVDTTKPEITIFGEAEIYLEVFSFFDDPGATALDDVDGDITENIITGGDIVDINLPGTYIITYNVTDSSGLSADEIIRTVIVEDLTIPEIALNGDTVIYISESADYIDPGATAFDNVDGDITENIVKGGNIVNTNISGTYIITYNVYDSSGLSADEETRTVIVDGNRPAITLIGEDIINLLVGSSFIDLGATAIDDVDGNISNNIITGGDFVNTNTVGTYSITYNISDSVGNNALQVTRTIIITNTLFVAVGWDGKILISPDGKSWSDRSINMGGIGPGDLEGIIYAKNKFVAVGHNIFTSSHGNNWNAINCGYLVDIAYGNGKFVAVGGGFESAEMKTSSNGSSWSDVTLDLGDDFFTGVVYGNNKFVAVGIGNWLMNSTDGLDWSDEGSAGANPKGITYGNDLFVVVDGSGWIATSTDGIFWERNGDFHNSDSNANWGFEGVTYGNGIFVAVGKAGLIATSPDGETWTDNSVDIGSHRLVGVTFGNNLFVAVGNGGRIMTSPDGETWTEEILGEDYLSAVTYVEIN